MRSSCVRLCSSIGDEFLLIFIKIVLFFNQSTRSIRGFFGFYGRGQFDFFVNEATIIMILPK